MLIVVEHEMFYNLTGHDKGMFLFNYLSST